MKKLVIAEKPSVARDVARIIGATAKRDGYIEGNGYIVSWTVGHLCGIAPPDKQNKAWTRWDLGTLPMIPGRFKLEVLSKTKQQFNILKKLLNDPDVTEAVAATDAGREGELIFRRVYQSAGCKKPIRRLWLSSMTDEAIRHAFANIRAGSDYNHLAAAAYARAESDWLIGMNETRAFTLKCGGELLTVGRVQTPVLAMLVTRRQEIENFKPQTYWELEAWFEHNDIAFKATWHRPPKFKDTRILARETCDLIYQKCSGHPAEVQSASQKRGRSQPPLLYDLTSLQRTCNARFGFSAKKTLTVAQALYEKQKAITYPRTDSQYISADIFKTLAAHFRAVRGHYVEIIAQLRQCFEQKAAKYRVVNDKQVTDHHAIIPTTRQVDLAALTDDQRKVYDLVCRRQLAAFLPAAEFQTTVIWLAINGEKFKTQGKVFEKLGWLAAEPWAIKSDTALPALQKGQNLEPKELKAVEKQTKAPSHFTDATILRAMETAGKLVADDELARAMKERGLGTPATRAQIIEALLEKKRGYAERRGKTIVATDKGVETVRIIHDLLPEALSPELTGEWEFKLKQVEKGQTTYHDFMKNIKAYVAASIERVKQSKVEFKLSTAPPRPQKEDGSGGGSDIVLGKCPLCGGDVVETPKAYGCARWRETGCKFAIWKKSFGGRVSAKAATDLLTKGQTARELTLTSVKTKQTYKAKLRLKAGKVGVVFNKDDEDLALAKRALSRSESTKSLQQLRKELDLDR